MTKLLDNATIRSYRDAGFHTPLRVLSPGEALAIRTALEAVEAERGTDRYGHFELEPAPTRDFDPAAVEMYRRTDEAQRSVYYRGASVAGATG